MDGNVMFHRKYPIVPAARRGVGAFSANRNFSETRQGTFQRWSSGEATGVPLNCQMEQCPANHRWAEEQERKQQPSTKQSAPSAAPLTETAATAAYTFLV